jgi:formate dehydrogenase subunit delta
MSELQQLIKMANQIADNFAYHEDREARVADHLQRFWAPRMRAALRGHVEAGGDGVADVVVAALERIATES